MRGTRVSLSSALDRHRMQLPSRVNRPRVQVEVDPPTVQQEVETTAVSSGRGVMTDRARTGAGGADTRATRATAKGRAEVQGRSTNSATGSFIRNQPVLRRLSRKNLISRDRMQSSIRRSCWRRWVRQLTLVRAPRVSMAKRRAVSGRRRRRSMTREARSSIRCRATRWIAMRMAVAHRGRQRGSRIR